MAQMLQPLSILLDVVLQRGGGEMASRERKAAPGVTEQGPHRVHGRLPQGADLGAELLEVRDTSSAAALGVGARTSATKSAIVTSVWWPTALITGTGQAAMARASPSSLKHQRSSRDPPPRATMTTSTRACTSARARRRLAGASSPWTRVGERTTAASGYRRRRIVNRS